MVKKKILIVAAVMVVLAGLGAHRIHQFLLDIPSAESLENYTPPQVTKILDAEGRPLAEFFTERRSYVPLGEIPADLPRAVIAIEDQRFTQHWGIDTVSIARAFWANLRAGRIVQGGSTITQQLAKNIFLNSRRTFERKIKELLLTLQVERRFSKDEIMELYLNQIYFGAGAYGAAAAARVYFGKRVGDLNLPECALLAGLIRSPGRYSPFENVQTARGRRGVVLARMREMGFITPAEEASASRATVEQTRFNPPREEASHFIDYVKKFLEPMFGIEELYEGGLTVTTTLNIETQLAAERTMEKHLSGFDRSYGAARRPKSGKASSVQVSTESARVEGALVALDPRTGAILAMVGGRDYARSQFNRAVQAKRQPGSAFKPFVWSAALEAGFTASSVVNDLPVAYINVERHPRLLAEASTYDELFKNVSEALSISATSYAMLEKKVQEERGEKIWLPKNYDERFLGPVTLRKALAKSRNLVSVRLVDRVGPQAVMDMAQKAGVAGKLDPVLSLGLGTSAIGVLELVNAYATLANGGVWAEPYGVEKVQDREGRVLYSHTPKLESRLSPETCYLITYLMQGVVQYGTGYDAKRLGWPVAGKTGTTQDSRDLWFIGSLPNITAGVWMGYDDYSSLGHHLAASGVAVPWWTNFMAQAKRSGEVKDFPVPPDIIFAKVDMDTGYLALPTCPHVILEVFKKGTAPETFCPVDHSKNPTVEEPIGE
jgi:penicillin-binding protein 1A